MKKYKYGTKAITTSSWYILAENKKEALKKAKQAEKNGEFTLGNVEELHWVELVLEEVKK